MLFCHLNIIFLCCPLNNTGTIGERNSKYFLNLENRNKKKSCIRKLIRTNGEETTAPDTIMNEIHRFYSEL